MRIVYIFNINYQCTKRTKKSTELRYTGYGFILVYQYTTYMLQGGFSLLFTRLQQIIPLVRLYKAIYKSKVKGGVWSLEIMPRFYKLPSRRKQPRTCLKGRALSHSFYNSHYNHTGSLDFGFIRIIDRFIKPFNQRTQYILTIYVHVGGKQRTSRQPIYTEIVPRSRFRQKKQEVSLSFSTGDLLSGTITCVCILSSIITQGEISGWYVVGRGFFRNIPHYSSLPV